MIVSVLQRWFTERKFERVCEDKRTPEQFEDLVNRFVTEFATQAYNLPPEERRGINNLNEYIQEISQRNGNIQNTKRDMVEYYRSLHNSYKDWMIDRDQENWANSQDHRKALIYRIASGIAFAALLLGVGFLADLWDIPLPLLRLI